MQEAKDLRDDATKRYVAELSHSSGDVDNDGIAKSLRQINLDHTKHSDDPSFTKRRGLEIKT
jgi:hypothetical protein